jgi:hypothetical protein
MNLKKKKRGAFAPRFRLEELEEDEDKKEKGVWLW